MRRDPRERRIVDEWVVHKSHCRIVGCLIWNFIPRPLANRELSFQLEVDVPLVPRSNMSGDRFAECRRRCFAWVNYLLFMIFRTHIEPFEWNHVECVKVRIHVLGDSVERWYMVRPRHVEYDVPLL